MAHEHLLTLSKNDNIMVSLQKVQSEETLGYDATIGTNGWPIDQRNPSTC